MVASDCGVEIRLIVAGYRNCGVGKKFQEGTKVVPQKSLFHDWRAILVVNDRWSNSGVHERRKISVNEFIKG
jgi:hypothetical protein